MRGNAGYSGRFSPGLARYVVLGTVHRGTGDHGATAGKQGVRGISHIAAWLSCACSGVAISRLRASPVPWRVVHGKIYDVVALRGKLGTVVLFEGCSPGRSTRRAERLIGLELE